jgi:hypothetical protein
MVRTKHIFNVFKLLKYTRDIQVASIFLPIIIYNSTSYCVDFVLEATVFIRWQDINLQQLLTHNFKSCSFFWLVCLFCNTGKWFWQIGFRVHAL